MNLELPRSVTIVGGGVAGVSTAAELRKHGFDGEVTIVDAGEMPYDRPPLSKAYLSGAQDLKQIALQEPGWYDDHSVRLLNFTRATALHPGEGAVDLDDGSRLRSDLVVLATGGRAARPPIPGTADDRVHVLRDVEDADRLRAAMVPGARILVVGAGLIGAEVASTAVDLGCSVTLVDPMSPPLAAVVGDAVATWLHDLHEARGITVVRAGVEAIEPASESVRVTLSDGGSSHDFDVVVLGVGMVPDTTLADQAGLQVNRGVLVDRTQTTSHPRVLAVGDPARLIVDGVVHPLAEHWEAAQLDARRAAANIVGAQPAPAGAPWFWSDRHHLHVEVVGQLAGAERLVVRGSMDRARFSVFALVEGLVVGAVSVDDSTSVRAARRMIDRALRVDPAQLGDPAHDLRKMLRA